MNKRGLTVSTVGGVLITTIITSIITQRPTKVYNKLNDWKNDRIKKAFYDTLTQEDIAWG
jgi:hypothetical protein